MTTVTKRDRVICLNCGRYRHQHYEPDGSWTPTQKCSEYEGRVATDDEWKAMLKTIDRAVDV